MKITKLLIANRGEIAVRIIKACRELNIETVAVYSTADAQALHVELADEAYLLGPPPPSESYLRGPAIIETAVQSGCQAVHPGFGFLAENAEFAQAVLDAGLIFIGPAPHAIRLMGSKTSARGTMAEADVPIVPGYQASQQDHDLQTAAKQIGVPLLVKASAGGGGKGMRLVQDLADLPSALASARREAQSGFGSAEVYLEKYIRQPHHIEFQVLGDQHGQAVHLFERECSIQRRHQKIIEETPSPLLTPELRMQMGEAALTAVRTVNYVNAGTIEFLVDGTSGEFYFLEMNTRLQVEHPITELVTGWDLVKLQIRVAQGEPLPFTQADLSQRGHAIECRLYAEDPANQFLPAIGRVDRLIEPTGNGIRVDTGIRTGDTVSVYYDPMIAKVVVLGEDRAEAICKMDFALREYVVLGEVITNLPFLRDVLQHPAFAAGDTPTSFISDHFPAWQPTTDDPPVDLLIAAALAELADRPSVTPQASESRVEQFSPWFAQNGFRVGSA